MPGIRLPVLAEAAGVLGDQLQLLLKRLASLLGPEQHRIDRQFEARLVKLNFNPVQRRALASLTVGAAARALGAGESSSRFFEEVEYQGKRLAKLNVPPASVISAFSEYDAVLEPVLRRLSPKERANFQWAREQLHFCIMLTLNNAYYQVREAETQTFYELSWAELEARKLDEFLVRFLDITARFCRAQGGEIYMTRDEHGTPEFECVASFQPRLATVMAQGAGGAHRGVPPASLKPAVRAKVPEGLYQARSFRTTGRDGSLALDPAWRGRYDTCWTVPMFLRGRLVGVIQFGFESRYDWLPREQELLAAAAERCAKAAEKARLLDDLSQREAQVRMLAERMLHVEEAERRRISRELHDQTGQDLLWIRLQMELIENEMPEGAQGWKSRLSEVRDMTERTIVEVRRLIAALSPAVLEQLGLVSALRQLVNRFQKNHPARVRLQASRLRPLGKRTETIAFRLIQECLNNAAKHSFCSNVNLSLHSVDRQLRISIEDDGVGFRVEDALNKPGSFGLAGIRERVALLGGKCEIESTMRSTEPCPIASETGKGKRRAKASAPARGRAPGTVIRIELPTEEAGEEISAASGGHWPQGMRPNRSRKAS